MYLSRDPIPVVDDQPVANIVCMYDYYTYVAYIIPRTVHTFVQVSSKCHGIEDLKREYWNSRVTYLHRSPTK